MYKVGHVFAKHPEHSEGDDVTISGNCHAAPLVRVFEKHDLQYLRRLRSVRRFLPFAFPISHAGQKIVLQHELMIQCRAHMQPYQNQQGGGNDAMQHACCEVVKVRGQGRA